LSGKTGTLAICLAAEIINDAQSFAGSAPAVQVIGE
jgi:hypothetical protein